MIKHYACTMLFTQDCNSIWLNEYNNENRKQLFGFMRELEKEESAKQCAVSVLTEQSGVILYDVIEVTHVHCTLFDNPVVIHIFAAKSNQVPTKHVYRYSVEQAKKEGLLKNMKDIIDYSVIKLISPDKLVPKMVFVN